MAVLYVPERQGGSCVFPPGTQFGKLTPFVRAPQFGAPVALPASADRSADSMDASIKQAKEAMDIVEGLAKLGEGYSFVKGFRRTTLRGIINLRPALNASGKLGGMVANAGYRTMFEELDRVGKKLGWVGLALSFADQSWRARDEIESLAGSSVSGQEKLGRGAAIATSIASRVMAETLVQPLELGMTVGGWISHYGFGEDTAVVDQAIATVDTTVRQVTDAKAIETYYLYVSHAITTKLW